MHRAVHRGTPGSDGNQPPPRVSCSPSSLCCIPGHSANVRETVALSRRKKVLIILGALCPIVMGSIYFWSRSDNAPRAMTPLPAGMELIPMSAVSGKPIIDLPWFGQRRLTYPPKRNLPSSIEVDLRHSGFVYWPSSPNGIAAASRWLNPEAFAYRFGCGVWNDGRDQFELPNRPLWASRPRDYVKLPYVYGEKPQRFTVTWLNAEDNQPVEAVFELPPNHQPPPITDASELVIADWRVQLQPKASPGPGFARKYAVVVKGESEADDFLCAIKDLAISASVDSLSRLPTRTQANLHRPHRRNKSPPDCPLQSEACPATGSGDHRFIWGVPI